MQVKEIMSKNVITCNENDSIKEAASLMLINDIGFLPVKRGKKVVGCLTDRDIVILGVANDNNAVKSIMTRNLKTINASADILEAMQLMSKLQIRRMLVENNHKLVGIIAIADIVNNSEKINGIMELLRNIMTFKVDFSKIKANVEDFEL